MVETSATSRSFPGWDAVPEDIIPDVDDTRDLGSEEKNWAALWVVLAFVTSITIGGIVNITTIDSWLFINASSYVNGSMNISENLFVDGNITASYYYGDGSNLSNVNFTELDPYWTGNQSSYFNTTDILGFSYYNSTDFDITDYFTSAEVLGFSYYNLTDFDIADYSTTATITGWGYYNSSDFDIADYFTSAEILGFSYYNSTDFSIADYYLKNNPFGFYNSTDFSIADYYLKNNPFGFYNSTDFSIADYYLKNNPFSFYNSTNPSPETLWTGNSTLVPYLASANVFTANQNLTGINITGINCMIYDSGGAICSGV